MAQDENIIKSFYKFKFLEQKLSLTVRSRTLHCDVSRTSLMRSITSLLLKAQIHCFISRTSLMRQHNFTCAESTTSLLY